jgi:hypothetical protein
MKKIYFALLSFVTAFAANAQSLSQANHAFAVGDSYKMVDCSTVSPGASGSGVTWNFSSLSVGTSTTSYTVVSVASTGSASSYPSASVAVQTGTNNMFYSSTSTEQKLWGGNIQMSGQSIEARYTNPAIVAQYPLVYNMTPVASSISGQAYVASINAPFTGNSLLSCDGVGTLVLPSRTFSNVIRVVTTQTLNYSLFTFTGSVKTEVYDFYAPGISKSPLLSISNGTFTQSGNSTPQSLAFIKGDYESIGIKENELASIDLKLFPNPVKSTLNINLYNENGDQISCDLINALGQTIKKDSFSSDRGNVTFKLNLDNVESGIYFVKVKCGNKISAKKITVQ